MTTGTPADFQSRIVDCLPRWFGDVSADPVLSGVIAAAAYVFSQVYGLLSYVRLQTRIKTATDGWLDLVSMDYFGTTLPRKPGEADAAFRARILAALFPQRVTRPGMVAALTVLTGTPPVLFEPWRPADAFVLGYSGLGTGKLGSYQMNAQAFISVTLPSSNAGAGIAGLGSDYAGLGAGYMALPSESELAGTISQQDVYDTVNAFKAEGTTVWVRINN
jgi:hypothetical protein